MLSRLLRWLHRQTLPKWMRDLKPPKSRQEDKVLQRIRHQQEVLRLAEKMWLHTPPAAPSTPASSPAIETPADSTQRGESTR